MHAIHALVPFRRLVRASPPGRGRALFTAAAVVIGFGLVLPACDDEIVSPSPQASLSVSPTGPITLEVGEFVQLSASVQNSTGTVIFTSSTPAVAEVSSSGLVTSASPGTTTITVTVQGTTLRQAVEIRVVTNVSDLSGGYASVIIVPLDGDPADHDPHVFDAGSSGRDVVVNLDFERGDDDQIQVTLEGRTIGPSTLPTLTGTAEETGERAWHDDVAADLPLTFSLSGEGTIAGFPNVSVTATGTVGEEGISMTIVVGGNGALPQGEPITYELEGTLQE